MMRKVRFVFLGLLMLAVVLLSLANIEPVTVNLLPGPLAAIAPWSLQLPLFVVILAAVLLGLLIGYVLEYIREHKHRKTASQKKREAELLAREVTTLKKNAGQTEDLSFLD
jgi:lipopolysaccharide assembly protein A